MADPISIAGLALTAVSAAVGTVGAISQGQAQAKASRYNAQVAENNATTAENNAKIEADRKRAQVNRVLGQTQAAAAKNGVEMSGSALDVYNDNAVQGELTALDAEYSGKVKAWNYRAQAGLDRMAADSASSSSMYSAGGSLLTAGSSVIRDYPEIF